MGSSYFAPYLSIGRLLDCFLLFAIMNNSSVNMDQAAPQPTTVLPLAVQNEGDCWTL